MAKMHKKIALCRPLDQRINDRIRPEENYIACSKLFLVDLLAPILLGAGRHKILKNSASY